MNTIGFFNVKGSMGTTGLVYHLAWMFQELGIRVVVLDLDPQCDLSAAFLPEEPLPGDSTIYGLVSPLLETGTEIQEPKLLPISENLAFLPGDLRLSLLTDLLAEAWWRCSDGETLEARAKAFGIMASFHRVVQRASLMCDASLVLIDVGQGLSAISRAALLACDFIIVPLRTGLPSAMTLSVLGDALGGWREGWKVRRGKVRLAMKSHFGPLPLGDMKPIGYVLWQYASKEEPSPLWLKSLDSYFQGYILRDSREPIPASHRLAILKHYRSLMPLAQDARKPMFLLKPADGAIGAYAEAVMDCYRDFKALAVRIAAACGITVP